MKLNRQISHAIQRDHGGLSQAAIAVAAEANEGISIVRNRLESYTSETMPEAIHELQETLKHLGYELYIHRTDEFN